MVIIKVLLFAFLISITNEFTCSITTMVNKYVDCRDKRPEDDRNNCCCFLHGTSSMGDIKRCVEVRRVDIKGKKFKATKAEIEKGTYDYWLMDNYTGFDEYNGSLTFSKIDSLRCNSSQMLKFFGLFAILFLLY